MRHQILYGSCLISQTRRSIINWYLFFGPKGIKSKVSEDRSKRKMKYILYTSLYVCSNCRYIYRGIVLVRDEMLTIFYLLVDLL